MTTLCEFVNAVKVTVGQCPKYTQHCQICRKFLQSLPIHLLECNYSVQYEQVR